MSKSPIYYPEEQGSGRTTIIHVLNKEQNAGLEKSIISQLLPLARSVSAGLDIANGGNTVVLADLDPTAEISKLQVSKAGQGLSFTFSSARGHSQSPKAKYYLCNFMRVPTKNQPAFLAAIDAYTRGIVCSGEFQVTFMHVVVAENEPEVVMAFQGFPTEKDAKFYFNHQWHWNFAPAVGNLMTELVGKWEGSLEELNTSKSRL